MMIECTQRFGPTRAVGGSPYAVPAKLLATGGRRLVILMNTVPNVSLCHHDSRDSVGSLSLLRNRNVFRCVIHLLGCHLKLFLDSRTCTAPFCCKQRYFWHYTNRCKKHLITSFQWNVLKLQLISPRRELVLELRDVTCHMVSHTVLTATRHK